jgi:hypothetical protein
MDADRITGVIAVKDGLIDSVDDPAAGFQRVVWGPKPHTLHGGRSKHFLTSGAPSTRQTDLVDRYT